MPPPANARRQKKKRPKTARQKKEQPEQPKQAKTPEPARQENKLAKFVTWLFDTYKNQLCLAVEGSQKYRDFISSTEMRTYRISGMARIQSFQVIKFGYPMRRAGYAAAVFSARVSQTDETYYAYAYWPSGAAEPEYICLSPTFDSRDGEYRHRFLWYPQFAEGYETLAELLSPVESAVLGTLGSGELILDATIFASGETASRVTDFVEKARLGIKAFVASLAIDVQRSANRTLQSHANSSYIAMLAAMHKKCGSIFDSWGVRELDRLTVFKNGEENDVFWPQCGQKLVPLTVRESLRVGDINFAPWRETWVGQRATDLVINGVAPMFPIYGNWTFLGETDRSLFENAAMRARYDRSLGAQGVAKSLREARRKAEKSLPDDRVGQLDAHIYESLVYAQDFLLLTDLAMCATSEYVGYTLRATTDIVRRAAWVSPAHLLMFSDPARIARYLFDLCYGAHQLHARVGAIHSDLHLNNMTIFKMTAQFIARRTSKSTTEDAIEFEERFRNPSIAYIAGAKGEAETYVFPHDGWYACLIDFSRAILGPAARPRIAREFGETFATNFFRHQTGRALRVLHHYIPSFVEKYQEKIKGLLLANFGEVFNVMTAVDFLAIGRNVGGLLRELDSTPLREHDRRILAVAPEGLALAQKIENRALEHLIVHLPELIAPANQTRPPIGPAGAGILPAVFGDFLFANQAETIRKATLVDVYNAAAPLEFSGDEYAHFPPWARFDDLKAHLSGLKIGDMISNRGARPFLQTLSVDGLFDLLQEQVRGTVEDRPSAATSSWIAE